MNRNQKIAIGCGGAGCLGLIVLVIVVVALSAAGYISLPGINTDTNRNSNSKANSNSSYNANSNTNSSSSSTMTDDARHKLYQAAGASKDTDLITRVLKKIGLGDGTGPDHQEFAKAHLVWARTNREFIRSVMTPEKARAYVQEHIND